LPTEYPTCPATSRDYRPTDGATLYPLWLARQDSPSLDEGSFCAALAKAWVRVACLADGQVVGFAAIDMPGQITQLITAQDFERQGVASLLLEDLDFLAGAMGAQHIGVNPPPAAEGFFTRRGFVSKPGTSLRMEKAVPPLR